MIDTNTIVGLLGGSLITIIIKEILNQFNKRQDFSRELKKITYERKLEKAENAIAFYWTYLNKIIESKKSFEVIIEALEEIDETDKDIEIIGDLLKKNGQAIIDLTTDKYSQINAIHLYFDLEEKDKWNETDLFDLIQNLSETKSIDNEIIFWLNLHSNALNSGDSKQADIYWNKTIEILPNYIKSLQKFIASVEKNQMALNSIILNIKKQLKRY